MEEFVEGKGAVKENKEEKENREESYNNSRTFLLLTAQ
jgi:hypothetical protein